MSLILLTRPPKTLFPGCISYYTKTALRRLIGKQRGPDGVKQSLCRGLNSIDKAYSSNILSEQGDTVHVLSNIEALRWAIEEKKAGRISKLIAGPNLVVIPTEYGSILGDSNIDIILVPSQWVKDFYTSLLPAIDSKIQVWPAGVSVPEETNNKKDICLVFKKVVPEDIFNAVTNLLREKGTVFKVIEYGNYKQLDYFEKLDRSKFMIYLQEVESQGIALQEAWARNVPTLVWNKGYFVYPTGHRVEGNIAAPFLTDQSGRSFSSILDLPAALDSFTTDISSFTPKEYVVEHLSDKASANTYARITGI